MKRKILVAMLIMMGAALPCMASEEDFVFDDYEYMLTQYTGSGGDVVIPDELMGCPVEGVASSVFYANSDITSLQLPQPLAALGSSCIYANENLTSVTIPENLIAIDEYNFYSCPQITEVVLPAKVSFIGTYSFAYCDNLQSVTFMGEVPRMETECFVGLAEDVVFYVPEDRMEEYAEALPEGSEICSNGSAVQSHDFTEAEEVYEFDTETGTITSYYGYGTRVDIPETIGGVQVKAIGESAFESHHYLYYVTIPEGVTEIGANAFAHVPHLNYVDFPDTLEVIGDSAFVGYRGESIQFAEGLEIIGANAFYLSELVELYFPETLKEIGNNAFESSYLTYLCFAGKELPKIGQDAFLNTAIYDVDLNWQASKEQMNTAQEICDSLGMPARVWRMQNPNVEYINDGLDTYENDVMTGYTGTQSHLRPWDMMYDYDITALGAGAFKGSKTLKYFAVPYNDVFTTIGEEAFADSTLEIVDLFDSVTNIEAGAFRNCINMKELILPESVEVIGESAFAGCSGLERVSILCDPSVIPEGAFEGCTSLENVYVAEDATDEMIAAAKTATGLKWNYKAGRVGEEIVNEIVTMPYEETTAAEFWYDEEYKRLDLYEGYEVNLYLPREVEGIPMEMIGGGMMGRSCLYDGEEEVEQPVRSVVIPETVTEIASYAFANCPTLETVVCYAPLENVEDLTFSGCSSLREVVFVNGVRNIGSMSFADCPALETVYVGEFVETISEDAFLGSGITVDDCIRTAAELPDVDAILAAVKSDPITPPETEAPVEVELEALDPEMAKPYIGYWKLDQIVFGGETYSPEELYMSMEFTLMEDGSAVLMADGEAAETQWAFIDGLASVVYDGEIYLQVAFQDENTLVCEESEDSAMIFARAEGEMEAVASVAVVEVPENAESSIADTASEETENYLEQQYICKNAKVSGIMMEASVLGGEYSVLFHGDGTLDFVMAGAEVPGLTWKNGTVQTDGGEAAAYVVTYFDGTDLIFVHTDTGFELDFYGSMILYFEK